MNGPMIGRGAILEDYSKERIKYVACFSWKTIWKALKKGLGGNSKGQVLSMCLTKEIPKP